MSSKIRFWLWGNERVTRFTIEVMSDDRWAVHLFVFNFTEKNDSLPSTRASPEMLR